MLVQHTTRYYWFYPTVRKPFLIPTEVLRTGSRELGIGKPAIASSELSFLLSPITEALGALRQRRLLRVDDEALACVFVDY